MTNNAQVHEASERLSPLEDEPDCVRTACSLERIPELTMTGRTQSNTYNHHMLTTGIGETNNYGTTGIFFPSKCSPPHIHSMLRIYAQGSTPSDEGHQASGEDANAEASYLSINEHWVFVKDADNLGCDVGLLKSEGCFHFPSMPILREFFEKYYLYVHPMLPLHGEKHFWAFLEHGSHEIMSHLTNAYTWMLLQAMLFAACPVRSLTSTLKVRL